MLKNFKTLPGYSHPLGLSHLPLGVNFALFSHHATAVSLCLFPPHTSEPIEIPLNPSINKTGDIWHILVCNIPPQYRYGYRVDGPYSPQLGHYFDNRHILLDPYAQQLDAPRQWKAGTKRYLGFVDPLPLFDWEGDTSPNIPFKDLTIYEMHVRGFTQDPSSKSNYPGSFLGVIEKIPYLKELGINAVEFMPIHEFREWDTLFENPLTQETLCNYWGYSTIHFFTPMRRYGSINDFKQMVKALHKAGIEVLLDVVYNHTGEGDIRGDTLSFRGLENSVYYLMDPQGQYYNFSGCGNTIACNHPIVREFIRHSLRYWVEEMHVDGFRFDLASIFSRDCEGKILSHPPIVEELSHDPVLSNTKLIAEAWDACGLYQVGNFPHFGRWAEWNGQYRDHVRRFIKGTDGAAGHFATRLCGSEDLYETRLPYHSINFITSHDGFTLSDLVSFNTKHNFINGEHNTDGDNNPESWNCGIEGLTIDPQINQLRMRQMKNFLLALFVSQGVPMLLMGDEYGHSKGGNNNTWAHDGRINWFHWNLISERTELFEFCKRVIQIRKDYRVLRRTHFLGKNDITFHGFLPQQPDWGTQSRFVAFSLWDQIERYQLYIAFNADYQPAHIQFPSPQMGRDWEWLIDTHRAEQPKNEKAPRESHILLPYSSIMLLSK